MIKHDDGDLREAEMLCRLEAAMPCNDTRRRVDKDRVQKPELGDAGCDLANLFETVRAGFLS